MATVDLLKRGLIKGAMSVAALALGLGWLTLTGGSDDPPVDRRDELPAVVFGGGGVIDIELELNQPGEFSATFERHGAEGSQPGETIDVHQHLEPGDHTFEVDVSEDAYSYFEVKIPEPTVGAELGWTVNLDRLPLTTEHVALDKPLAGNYAFFLSFEIEDMESWRDWQAGE